MSLSSDIISRTVKTQKLFNYQPGNCYYINIQTSKKNQKIDEEPIIKITNTCCKKAGSLLVKTTEIRFKERLIVIEDQYIFKSSQLDVELNGQRNSSQPTKCSDTSNQSNSMLQASQRAATHGHKKKLIFKKRFYEDHSRIQKRNTKNIAKNYCKAFKNYLQSNKNIKVLTRTKQIMSLFNYNNKTIQALGNDPITKQQFILFLKQKASEWIQSSKIYDKSIHYQAKKLYLTLIQNRNMGQIENEEISDGNRKFQMQMKKKCSSQSAELFEQKSSSND